MLNRLRRKPTMHRFDAAGEAVMLVVGLGNPGRKYQNTRHNLGFMVVDRIHDRLPPGPLRSRFQSQYVETVFEGRKIVLVKPQTFMNDSGVALGQLVRWYKVPVHQVLVIYDELDLPFGTIRLRPGGSVGGHNGLASVVQHLNSNEVPRLRVGIGRPRTGSNVPYVLSAFFEDERRELPALLDHAADAALMWVNEGMTVAMNEFNRRPSTTSDSPHTGS